MLHKGGIIMKFLEYVYANTEGLIFIDKLRNTIKGIVSDEIKKECLYSFLRTRKFEYKNNVENKNEEGNIRIYKK